ncbi:uncharacterized protein LOC143613419 [Bidens hawaiensis]|uniref:uncharacterized protein LOC143613419 n=1 Tax=Bidens hawaiensis TaxID=980011 RepID=UPI00404A0575
MDCYYGARVEGNPHKDQRGLTIWESEIQAIMDHLDKNSYQPKFCVVYDKMGNIIGCKDSSGAMMDHIPHPEEILYDVLRVTHNINPKAPLSDIMDDFRRGLKYQIQFYEPTIKFEDIGLQDKTEDRIPSWEDEFRDEFGEDLVGSADVDESDFDPERDLEKLEVLLFGEPVKKQNVKEESQEISEELKSKELHLVVKEQPRLHGKVDMFLEIVVRGSPRKSRAPRRKIFGLGNQSVPNWAYMSLEISFFPTSYKRRVLRSTDGKRIKEKPPD